MIHTRLHLYVDVLAAVARRAALSQCPFAPRALSCVCGTDGILWLSQAGTAAAGATVAAVADVAPAAAGKSSSDNPSVWQQAVAVTAGRRASTGVRSGINHNMGPGQVQRLHGAAPGPPGRLAAIWSAERERLHWLVELKQTARVLNLG